ncbi:MAG: DNA/RNA nuclease SfsA [Deltaproteobacteria bacterium]|nr:MAG: DNA/RNA nuclease SfsA [Deltaproteobacteria bacterium]
MVIGGASDYPKHVLIPHRWPGTARTAVLVERPNRFLAVCKLGRRTVEAHVPDRGRCLDLLMPGREVALVAAAGPLRRTKYTALLARSGSGAWVSLDPGGAPRLVAAALEARILPWGLRVSRREIAVRSSRIDLLLEPGDVLCEVKSVGAARDGVALFPDAPTVRGLRHLALLSHLARRGRRCAVVLCAQRGDVRAVATDDDIDPAFARALRRAAAAGVRIGAIRCAAHLDGMELHCEIPVLL